MRGEDSDDSDAAPGSIRREKAAQLRSARRAGLQRSDAAADEHGLGSLAGAAIARSGGIDLTRLLIEGHFDAVDDDEEDEDGDGDDGAVGSAFGGVMSAAARRRRALAASASLCVALPVLAGPSVGVGPFIVDARTGVLIGRDSSVLALKKDRSRRRSRGGDGGDSGAESGGGGGELFDAPPLEPAPPLETMAAGLLLRPVVTALLASFARQVSAVGVYTGAFPRPRPLPQPLGPRDFVSVYELEREEMERLAATSGRRF